MSADLESGPSEKTKLLGAASLPLDSLTKATSGALDFGLDVAEQVRQLTPRLRNPIDDSCVIMYDPVELTSWRVLGWFKGTIFTQSSLWYVIGATFLVATVIAAVVAFVVDAPEHFDSKIVSSVIKVVTVAMAFLLGLFVNNALARWWDIVKTFETMFGSIKRLLAILINFEVDKEIRYNVARLGVLSTVILRFENVAAKEAALQGKPVDDVWSGKMQALVTAGEMTPEERAILDKVPEQSRAFFIWQLIGKEVKKVRDGKVQMNDQGTIPQKRPSVASAEGAGGVRTKAQMDYRLLYNSVSDGATAVSMLKSSANFHFPFLYVHMLAWMVHLVNFLTAIGAGFTIGMLIAQHRVACQHSFACPPLDGGVIFRELLFLYLQVFLYQAFLSIGAALSFPIVPVGHGAMYRLPLAEMIEALRAHAALANELADQNLL